MKNIKQIILGLSLALAASSCVSIDQTVGSEFLSDKDRFEVKFFDMDIQDISLKTMDSLSNYSTSRAVFGTIKDDTFGLTTRGVALTVVPMETSLDLGLDPQLLSFHFAMAKDTLSYIDPCDAAIIQNVLVYELEKPIDSTGVFTNSLSAADFAGKPFVAQGHPIYSGGDSLSFDFTAAYAQKFIDALRDTAKAREYCDSIPLFVQDFPGIFICTDNPVGSSGRINLMKLPVTYDSSYGYITGNYAELKIRSKYYNSDSTEIRENVDTSFYFYYGATQTYSTSSTITQYAFNFSGSESVDKGIVAQAAADNALYVEGAGGVKPVVSSKSLRDAFLNHLSSQGIDRSRVIVNKATLSFHYVYDPASYEKYNYYPAYLSPWVRLSTSEYVAYAGITDSTVSTENQGEMNRSCLTYSPDITHHFQELVRCDTLEVSGNPAATARNFANRDIWLIILANEVEESSSSSTSSSYDDYYNALMYSQYYDSMYGGYGYGYGSYGGYGSYYNNYYTYAMLAALYSSQSTTEYTTAVDLSRFYNCKLYSPTCADAELRPHLSVTYSVRKQ